MSDLASTAEILKVIQKVVGPSSPDDPITLHEPDFAGQKLGLI